MCSHSDPALHAAFELPVREHSDATCFPRSVRSCRGVSEFIQSGRSLLNSKSTTHIQAKSRELEFRRISSRFKVSYSTGRRALLPGPQTQGNLTCVLLAGPQTQGNLRAIIHISAPQQEFSPTLLDFVASAAKEHHLGRDQGDRAAAPEAFSARTEGISVGKKASPFSNDD